MTKNLKKLHKLADKIRFDNAYLYIAHTNFADVESLYEFDLHELDPKFRTYELQFEQNKRFIISRCIILYKRTMWGYKKIWK